MEGIAGVRPILRVQQPSGRGQEAAVHDVHKLLGIRGRRLGDQLSSEYQIPTTTGTDISSQINAINSECIHSPSVKQHAEYITAEKSTEYVVIRCYNCSNPVLELIE